MPTKTINTIKYKLHINTIATKPAIRLKIPSIIPIVYSTYENSTQKEKYTEEKFEILFADKISVFFSPYFRLSFLQPLSHFFALCFQKSTQAFKFFSIVDHFYHLIFIRRQKKFCFMIIFRGKILLKF